jgi:miniconductance mechanosensitive channel
MTTWLEKLFIAIGVPQNLADEFAIATMTVLIVTFAYLIYWVLRNYLLKIIHQVTQKTSNKWDDALMESRTFHRVLRLIPLTFILLCIDRIAPGQLVLIKRVLFALIILVGARAAEAFLNAISNVYHSDQESHRKPIRPLFQALLIVLYLFAGIFIISVLLNKEPWNLLIRSRHPAGRQRYGA